MFEHAFSWLDTPELKIDFLNQPVTLSDCVVAKEAAAQRLQQTMAMYRFARYAPTSASQSTALQALQHQEQCQVFLKACHDLLQNKPNQSLYSLMLTLVMMQRNTAKAALLFDAWLAETPVPAMEFYEFYRSSQASSERAHSQTLPLVLTLAHQTTRHFINELDGRFLEQQNPLAFCDLLPSFSGEPLRWQAFLHWMISKGATPEGIFQTGIFHQFLNYHFHDLYFCGEALIASQMENKFNDLAIMYALLEQDEVTRPLVRLAEHASCDVPGHESYNLLGRPSLGLLKTEVIPEKGVLTRTLNTARDAIAVFGEAGLAAVVHQLFHGSNDEFDVAFMKETHLHPHWISSSLLNDTAETRPNELYKWALLVEAPVFQERLKAQDFSILYLLSYQPTWIASVDRTMLDSFLQSICADSTPGSEHHRLQLLLCLYEAMSVSDGALSGLVYEAMLSVVLEHPYVIEDVLLFRTLRSSIHAPSCINEKLNALMDVLEGSIHTFIMDAFGDYSELKSHWRTLLKKVAVLDAIQKNKPTFPHFEMDFKLLIFQIMALNPSCEWDQLMQVLAITDMRCDVQKQLAIKILTRVDNAALRVHLLSTLAFNHHSFVEDDGVMLLESIAANNIGLLNWIMKENPLDEEMLNKAIDSKRWDLIEQWCQLYDFNHFSDATRDQLLIQVAGSRKSSLLRELICKSERSFSRKGIASAFSMAASIDDPYALRSLYALKPMPMDVKVAFSQATKGYRYQALCFFKEFKKQKPNLADEITRTFNQAVKSNDLKMVTHLLDFTTNGPSRKVIRLALERALDRRQVEMGELLNNALGVPVHKGPSTQKRVHLSKSFFSTDSLMHFSPLASPL